MKKINEINSINYKVYSTLKSRIINLEYKPGRSISVATLAQDLNVSRSPVRDALLRLSRENLVEIFPQVGSRVSLINIPKTEEERFVRKSLEIAAIKSLFYNYDDSTIDEMRHCIDMQRKAGKKYDYLSALQWDNAFHKTIFKSIKKENAWTLVQDYTPNERRVRLLATAVFKTTQDTVLQNHIDLVNSIEKRDLKSALAIIEQHLTRISEEIIRLIGACPDIFQFEDIDSANYNPPAKIRSSSDSDSENYIESLSSVIC